MLLKMYSTKLSSQAKLNSNTNSGLNIEKKNNKQELQLQL